MRTLLLAVMVLLLGLASPASAGHTKYTMSPSPEPYATWLNQMQVATPRGKVRLHVTGDRDTIETTCRQLYAGACWVAGGPDRGIWIRDPQIYSSGDVIPEPDQSRHRRLALYHETGHAFDDKVMTRRQRYLFKRISGQSKIKGWLPRSGKQPGETFADAYARCAWFGSVLPADTSEYPDRHYGLLLEGDRHTRACRLINRASRNRHVALAKASHLDRYEYGGSAYNPADNKNHAWLFHVSYAYLIEEAEHGDSRMWDGSHGAHEVCNEDTWECWMEARPGARHLDENTTGEENCDHPSDFPDDPETHYYSSADSSYESTYTTPAHEPRMLCGAKHEHGPSWFGLANDVTGALFK